MHASQDWLSHQLSGFLAAVSSYPDEATALEGGAEALAEAVEAEVVAVVVHEEVAVCLGFQRGTEPHDLLRKVSVGVGSVDLPDLGPCASLCVQMEDEDGTSRLVLLRADSAFSTEEIVVVRGMEGERTGRRISEQQARENDRLLASLRERQELLERLFRIQRSISHRAPVGEVFEAITDGAAALLDAEVVGLRLLDPIDPSLLRIVASVGVDPEVLDDVGCSRVGEGVGGRAVLEERLVIAVEYQG